jgi:wyosine [tRNA(Phe)-imidazoG37] synthetase (radical SAM superfamily)
VVTFSGNGEPTLALNLGACLRLAKAVTGLPSIVLTNGSLLVDPEVRRDLQLADRVFVKLDAVDQPSLARVNRPVEGVTLASILDGTRSFRAEYAGHLAVQVMLLPGCQGSLDRLGDLLLDLRPDEVQLNTPLRPVPRTWYLEARGRHHDPAPVPTSHLKTLTPGEAALAEEHLRRRTGLPVVSVYEPGRT